MAIILHYFTKCGRFGGWLHQNVDDRPMLSATKCSPKNLVFSDVWLWRYSQRLLRTIGWNGPIPFRKLHGKSNVDCSTTSFLETSVVNVRPWLQHYAALARSLCDSQASCWEFGFKNSLRAKTCLRSYLLCVEWNVINFTHFTHTLVIPFCQLTDVVDS